MRPQFRTPDSWFSALFFTKHCFPLLIYKIPLVLHMQVISYKFIQFDLFIHTSFLQLDIIFLLHVICINYIHTQSYIQGLIHTVNTANNSPCFEHFFSTNKIRLE